MQFTSALRKQRGFLGINAADQFFEQRAGRSLILEIGFTPEDALVITTDRIERERPGITLAGDRVLQKTHDGWLGFATAIFHRAMKCRDIRETRAVSQKSRDFDVRIYAVLEFPIKLKKEFVFEEHWRIALFSGEHIRVGNFPDILNKRRTNRADEVPIFSAGRLSI